MGHVQHALRQSAGQPEQLEVPQGYGLPVYPCEASGHRGYARGVAQPAGRPESRIAGVCGYRRGPG